MRPRKRALHLFSGTKQWPATSARLSHRP